MPSASAFFPFGGERKAVGDLVAITKLIEHANKVTKNDFAKVTGLLEQAQDERFALDNDLAAWQARLGPACQEYAEARNRVLAGEGLVPPLAKSVVQAQGIANNILMLGAQTPGCIDTCEYPGGADAPGSIMCKGRCSKTLKERKPRARGPNLFKVLEESRQCHSPHLFAAANDIMFVDPPAGFAAAEDSGENHAEDQWAADEAKTLRAEIALPLALPFVRPPPVPQPRRPLPQQQHQGADARLEHAPLAERVRVLAG
eukprot:CAMPEP_0115579330 /NCGR_PEP_ID=MMETSP0272-20121206/4050_1 /TAXON_ID=71861 /ORGANISM="Scrippsiella trochoidea, Strain CCMP3099" /LENGTH=257 /DNA_ID=CAMNT_0003014205 /DNA_START=12 /DNA_END=784 /DNA_ORIENTATION=+